ncbi:MAG: hypothetical protein MJ252_16795 [archaeon]|nr:hypothetical protein [archaeon]
MSINPNFNQTIFDNLTGLPNFSLVPPILNNLNLNGTLMVKFILFNIYS